MGSIDHLKHTLDTDDGRLLGATEVETIEGGLSETLGERLSRDHTDHLAGSHAAAAVLVLNDGKVAEYLVVLEKMDVRGLTREVKCKDVRIVT